MKFSKILKFHVMLWIICFANASPASSSREMNLVGEIISFDQTYVKIRSGKQLFTLSRSELDHPKFIVGEKIEVPLRENIMKQARRNR